MKFKAFITALALLPALAHADKYSLDAEGNCNFRKDQSLTVKGSYGGMDFAAWQCRPAVADRNKQRNWNRYYRFGSVFAAVMANPKLASDVIAAFARGDEALGTKLANGFLTLPLDHPSFSQVRIVADRELDKIAVPNAVLISNGQPCACDVRAGPGPAHMCIAASAVTPAVAADPVEAAKVPLQACRGT